MQDKNHVNADQHKIYTSWSCLLTNQGCVFLFQIIDLWLFLFFLDRLGMKFRSFGPIAIFENFFEVNVRFTQESLLESFIEYSRKGNKRGGSLTVFPKLSRPSWTKMSEISINTVENIDEIDQITLLTICTTKLHRCYSVTLHFLIFTKNFFRKFHHPFVTLPPLLPLRE